MKHIQKTVLLEKKFSPEGAIGKPTSLIKKEEPKTKEGREVQAEMLKQKEAITWYTKRNLNHMVDDIQAVLKSGGYDVGTVDGKIGPKTVAAIMQFQRDAGLSDDGKAGKATMKKLNIKGDKVHVAGAPKKKGSAVEVAKAPTGTVNYIKRAPKNVIEHIFGAKGEKTDTLASIDDSINANSKKLLPLQAAIIDAKISGRNLDKVYLDTIGKISGKLDKETNKTLASLTSKKDRTAALDYISQALWGSEKTVEVARGSADSKEYVRSRNKALNILKKQGFSSSLISAMKSKVSSLQKDMKGKLPTDRREGFMYTVRSQGNLSTVEPVTHQELVGINGQYTWDIPQTKADMQNYVEYMSEAQVALLLKAWGIRDGVKGKTHAQRKARIKRFMNITGRKLDIKLVFAENCGNIGMIAVPTKIVAPVWESDNNNNTSSETGGISSTPTETETGDTVTGGEGDDGDQGDQDVGGGFGS